MFMPRTKTGLFYFQDSRLKKEDSEFHGIVHDVRNNKAQEGTINL